MAALTSPADHSEPCLVLGDSIAVGIAKLRPACEMVAEKGITSDTVVEIAPPDRGYRYIIVAMGSNDRWHTPLPQNLTKIRAKYAHAKFAWISPRRGRSGQTVVDFARSNGDQLVQLTDFPSRDTVHPSDFAAVAASLP